MPSLALNLVAAIRRIPNKATGATDGDVMSYEQLLVADPLPARSRDMLLPRQRENTARRGGLAQW
jgi:hypothetical protein